MESNEIYLCQQCREFQNNEADYLEKITEPYLNEFCYEISFPFGKPGCKKCNSELIYINELECSKEIKCPKCDEEFKK